MNIEFKCPHCGQHKLEEYVANVSLYSTVSVNEDEESGAVYVDWTGEYEHQDGDLVGYNCSVCAFRITEKDGKTPITDPTDLAKWLKDNQNESTDNQE